MNILTFITPQKLSNRSLQKQYFIFQQTKAQINQLVMT